MGYRKEEQKKSLCLKETFKTKVKRWEGRILLLLFITMLVLLGEVAPRMAKFILSIDFETMNLIVKIMLYSTSIGGVLVNLKKEKEN